MAKLNIVLYEPEIPQNTGNIARLCACTGASLYLVGKLGFALTDKYTKRAGMDYWDSVDLHKINTMDELFNANPNANFYYLTTKTKRKYTDIEFKEGDYMNVGDIVGTVAAPTKYFAVEGANVYFKLTQNGEPVDPLNQMS